MADHYRIMYENPKYGDYLEGLALPLFIHNGHYFYVTLDIYADGVAECWGLVPINALTEKLESGWITTEPPVGARISVRDLGGGVVKEVDWHLPKNQIIPTVQALFHDLNPNASDLFDMEERRKLLADEWNTPESMKNKIGQSRMRLGGRVYRRDENGMKIPGATIPLFYETAEGVTLTNCFVYADGQLSIGYEGKLLSVDAMHTLIQQYVIRTSIEDDVWIHLAGLGRFKLESGYWHIEKEEMWKQVMNRLNMLNGQPDVVSVCHQAFLTYEANPTDANREILRTAYDAVPAHYRLYTQRDQDAKDHDIRRILSNTSD